MPLILPLVVLALQKLNSLSIDILNSFSRISADRDSMVKDALDLAGQIAKKSPVAMAGIKHNLNFSRDHSAQQGLEYMVSTTENQRSYATVLFILKSLRRTAPRKNCRSTVGRQSAERKSADSRSTVCFRVSGRLCRTKTLIKVEISLCDRSISEKS